MMVVDQFSSAPVSGWPERWMSSSSPTLLNYFILRWTVSHGTTKSSSTTTTMEGKCRWQCHKQTPRFISDDGDGDDDGDDDGGGDHGDGDGDGDGPGVLEPNRGGRLHRRHWTDLFQHFGKYQVHDP